MLYPVGIGRDFMMKLCSSFSGEHLCAGVAANKHHELFCFQNGAHAVTEHLLSSSSVFVRGHVHLWIMLLLVFVVLYFLFYVSSMSFFSMANKLLVFAQQDILSQRWMCVHIVVFVVLRCVFAVPMLFWLMFVNIVKVMQWARLLLYPLH